MLLKINTFIQRIEILFLGVKTWFPISHIRRNDRKTDWDLA